MRKRSVRRQIAAWMLAVSALSACAADWPQFRGPAGDGHSAARDLPVNWSETENVAWKTPIAGRGWSSPAVWGQQIWLTTALDEGKSLRAVCVDRASGQIVHDVEVFAKDNPGNINSKNSHASPTPIVDGERVIVHFGAHGTACLSTAGKVLWRTNELKYNHVHGPGGSPVVWQDLVILSCDGADQQFLVALDKRTGTMRWRTDRAHTSAERLNGESRVPMAYTTPLLVEIDGRPQVVSAASDFVAGFEPATGQEIWWSRYDGYSNVAMPAFGHGLIFVTSGYDEPVFFAVGAGGRGDVTESLARWSTAKAVPLDVSPLVVGDELYLLSNGGVATCLDAVSGQVHWQKRLPGTFSASLVWADGRIFATSEDGATYVLAPGATHELLATNHVPGRVLASLAPVDREIYLRSDTHLYRIEKRR